MATIERSKAEVAAPESTDLLYYGDPSAYSEAQPSPAGAGWLLFSVIVLAFAGVWAIIEGILAVTSSKIYVGDATFVFSDLNTWGWIVMGLGILTVIAAFGVSTGSEFARWFGISVAGLNAFGQLMFLHANPWWAVAMFAVDILIIYGLAVYGGSRLRAR
jgi:hypothetical protein